ncbi:hypothetical protein KAR91_08820 [Candidatus Pacearchaeota archaeon]|nr:hypothetical protein [Candidatus Pacearchaeota archaeon]
MKNLFESIYAHYLTDPLSSSLTDLYNTEADDDSVYPYAVFSMISNVADFTFEEDFEDVLIQFNLYSDTSSVEEISDLFELLKGDTSLGEGFDFKDLNITDYGAVSLVRQNATLIKEEKIWGYSIVYEFKLEKTTGEGHFHFKEGLYNLLSI